MLVTLEIEDKTFSVIKGVFYTNRHGVQNEGISRDNFITVYPGPDHVWMRLC